MVEPAAAEAINHAVQGSMIQLDLSTALAVIATFVSVGTLVWKAGSDSAQRKAFETYSTRADEERTKWKENFEKSVDARFASESGLLRLCQDQIAEVRENIAKNYMTKGEIKEIENRVTNSQDRILDHLDRIDGRLNEMQARVLDAINKATTRG